MKSNGWCLFMKAKKRIPMRKNGLEQTEMLLIYLFEIDEDWKYFTKTLKQNTL